MTRSQFPWEQEALDFIYDEFPAQDNYRAWANFEFIADDGSINEVDLLVACPQGVFLIEIKSDPGELSGDTRDWTWSHEGRKKTVENPVILTNRKCKRLKSYLGRQNAFRKEGIPFFEPLVFVSHPEVVNRLSGNAMFHVAMRDAYGRPGMQDRPGIMAAIRRRECPGMRQFEDQQVKRPQIKALAQAMEQAGIRPSQKSRRVGDFVLEELLFDSPLGIYQDWKARHVSINRTLRVARLYMVSRQATPEDREIIGKAAIREFELLDRLDHPGILKADPPTECEYGPVLFLRQPPNALFLDQFLIQEGSKLTVDGRLDILRQVGEIIAYAHGRKIVHRSLSPKSILVWRDSSQRPFVQILNWQTGTRLSSGEPGVTMTQMSVTMHAGQLIEDVSQVFVAPEALAGNADGRTELDSFSLGALTYFLFSGKPPASSVTELQKKLKASLSGGLNISEAMDGAVDSLVELVRCTANGTASDRVSVEDFLAALDLIEDELTSPASSAITNPLEAKKGDELEGGFRVEARLGSGSVSVVFLVDFEDKKQVLKVARSAQYNQRIRDEFNTLREIQEKVRSRIVVAPFDLIEFGELVGFTMEPAFTIDLEAESKDDEDYEKTMARYLREKGPLDLSYLQRFGDDLIRTIRDLDEAGIAHRDIKPENLGLRVVGKKQYQLCLFDFSLSNASPEDIKVGTLAYMDPFLSERKVKRWDISSECFSAAMALHEMTTGVLPAWGDGKSDPASVKGEVHIEAERFDPDLRDRFADFFRKALSRDFRSRFDNPSEMLRNWNDIFATLDERKISKFSDLEPEAKEKNSGFDLPEHITPATQLVLLGLSTRLLNTLDRLNLITIGDLLGYPLRKILHLRGVGNKTRRELGELVRVLRQRLPDFELDPIKAIQAASQDEEETPDAVAGVDLIARQVAIIGRGQDRVAEQQILQAFLGWNRPESEDATEWPSQSDLALRIDVTRQRIGQVITEGRERWRRFPAITALRETIYGIVAGQGGVVTHDELVASVLAARGSAFDEPKRTQMASVATRAAMETERGLKEARFQEYRSAGRTFIAMSPELKNFAVELGKVADELAGEYPIPSPASVLEALHRVKIPEIPEDVGAPTDQRLCQLAVGASGTAALSSRMEIYRVGLVAESALRLAQNALFGGTLTVNEIQARVAARFPRAEPLPGRPQLDKLIDSLGLDLKWQQADASGKGAYLMAGGAGRSLQTSESFSARQVTRVRPASVQKVVPPDIAEAQAIEEKLTYAAANGGYLAISVPSGYESNARLELERRFPVETCDLDAAFITSMREQAAVAGADWSVVVRADASSPDSADWKNLQMLVERCLPTISTELRSPERTKLLVHPGLLSRYDRMNVLGDLAADVGRSDGIYGLWVLVPGGGSRPVLNNKAIPLSNPAQHVHLNRAWLANKHRA
ncbi:MAG: BREX system serine/threonine kinase PglW [Opitutales bacterium]